MDEVNDTRLASGRWFEPGASWQPGQAIDRKASPTDIDTAGHLGAEAHAALLVAAMDELDRGVVVCDAHAQPLVMNIAARREIAEGGVLRLERGGSLSVAGGTGHLLLRRAIHNAARNALRQLVVLRAGVQTLMLGAVPLNAGASAPRCALLLLGRRSLCPDLAVEMLGRLYELTSAERSVLKSLLAGKRVSELAKARGVALSTIRSQMAALRGKFGVHRFEELTRLVAEMPPMTSALHGVSHSQRPSALNNGRVASRQEVSP